MAGRPELPGNSESASATGRGSAVRDTSAGCPSAMSRASRAEAGEHDEGDRRRAQWQGHADKAMKPVCTVDLGGVIELARNLLERSEENHNRRSLGPHADDDEGKLGEAGG